MTTKPPQRYFNFAFLSENSKILFLWHEEGHHHTLHIPHSPALLATILLINNHASPSCTPTHRDNGEDARASEPRFRREVGDVGGREDQRHFRQRIDDAADDLLQDPSTQQAPGPRRHRYL